jgi:hypothetical protein
MANLLAYPLTWLPSSLNHREVASPAFIPRFAGKMLPVKAIASPAFGSICLTMKRSSFLTLAREIIVVCSSIVVWGDDHPNTLIASQGPGSGMRRGDDT